MAEWLVEEGIAEHRAILLERSEIVAAQVDWPGQAAVGDITEAILVFRIAGSSRGTVRLPSGDEAVIDRLPRHASEGAALRVEVTRTAIAERGRTKLPQVRPTDAPIRHAPGLAARLNAKVVQRFPECGWTELYDDAWDAQVAFPGGMLTVSPTPAMTLIDVDGALPPPALALAAAPIVAKAIRRFDLAGSIGIDFPTLAEKAHRRAVDAALGEALDGWPHEQTAMNGFGFVQVVSRLERPSLVARIELDRPGAAARALLRQAQAIAAPGVLLLTAHPAVRAALRAEWETELARRSGRMIRWQEDPRLALSGGFAQAVTS